MAEIKQLNTRIQLRNDTAANWESANPILLKGEVGVVLGAAGEKARFKIGDGTTAWNNLEFSDGSLTIDSGNVIMDKDFVATAPIGVVTIPSSGSTTLTAKNKT